MAAKASGADCNDGYGRRAQHGLRIASEHRAADAAPAMSAHDYYIGQPPFGFLRNALGGPLRCTLSKDRLRPHAASLRESPCVAQDLFAAREPAAKPGVGY